MKLVQKHLLKGNREFELVDDAVNVRIDMPFLKEELTVVLSILDPEPVEVKGNLAFVSVVNREPLLELFIDKPDPDSFKAFVARLSERITEEDFAKPKARDTDRNINTAHLQEALTMLQTYLPDDDIQPLLATLQALKDAPGDAGCFDAMCQAYNDLGPRQGAVLTYAPYIVTLLSDNEFD